MSARITRHEVSVALCFTSEPSFVAQNPRLGECAGADSEERERVPGAATFVATKERDRDVAALKVIHLAALKLIHPKLDFQPTAS